MFTGLNGPLRFQECEAYSIYGQPAHEGVKVVSPTHRPPLTPRRYPWYSLLLPAQSTQGQSAAGRIISFGITVYSYWTWYPSSDNISKLKNLINPNSQKSKPHTTWIARTLNLGRFATLVTRLPYKELQLTQRHNSNTFNMFKRTITVHDYLYTRSRTRL